VPPESRCNNRAGRLGHDRGHADSWREPDFLNVRVLMGVAEDTARVPQTQVGPDESEHGNTKPYDKFHALMIHCEPLACPASRVVVSAIAASDTGWFTRTLRSSMGLAPPRPVCDSCHILNGFLHGDRAPARASEAVSAVGDAVDIPSAAMVVISALARLRSSTAS
jgi:hypothetical protein